MLEMLAACANVVVPEATPKAMEYYTSGNLLWIVGQVMSLGLPLLFLFTGFSGWLSKVSEKWGKKWFFTIAVYLVLYIVVNTIIDLPLSFYASYVREHAYGLSTETLAKWFADFGKGTMISIISSVMFVWIFYLLLKKSPRRWWLYSTFVSIGIIFLMSFVQPIWIDPLFNDFGPMKNKKLEKEILALAAKAGISKGRVYEVNKSEETKTLNAYVNGVGSSSRIVLWDTTIQQMNTDELLSVMAHEMGHYVLHHMWWGLGFFSVTAFVVFYLVFRSANYMMRKYNKKFGFKHIYNIASIPLLLFLSNLYMLAFTPLSNYFTRQIEHNADIFSLEILKDNKAAGESFLILQRDNLANPRPGPIFNMWRATHPSLGDRVDFTNQYCPWTENKPLKYGKYFD